MTAPTFELAEQSERHLEEALDAISEAASAQAESLGHPVLASLAVPIPAISPLELLSRSDDPVAGWWSQPGLEAAGTGIAVTIEAAGPERLAELAAGISDRFSTGVAEGRMPVAFAGASFAVRNPEGAWAGFPQASAWVPETCVIREDSETWLAAATMVNPGEPPGAAREHLESLFGEAGATLARELDPGLPVPAAPGELKPDDAGWDRSVDEVLARIREGALSKVVLARTWSAPDTGVAPWALAGAMGARHSDAFLYGVLRGDATFVGASPELLVERTDGTVRATPTAATVPIDGPADGLDTDKSRREHAFVADAVAETLRLWCDDVRSEPQAHVIQAGPVRHLATTIEGRLSRPAHVLELAGALHPTPAVCGVPLHRASEFIAEHEGFDRGWYAGPIGIVHPDGSGTIAVALRCALVHADGIDCFAGAGIVEGSIPEEERLEVDLKMSAVRSALAAVSS